ncbi:MAG TPA: ferritin-like domain-containing protein [Solirubrobacteraceae bacterium]|nr:ferritin-like domain-containing protein [Solirubrobacteraceae bacterium]
MSPAEPATRRRLLGITLGSSAAAAALSGCAGTKRRLKLAGRSRDSDARLLNELLLLERRAIAAYTAGIPLLSGGDLRAGTAFLRQELAHAGMLIALIKRAGGTAPPRLANYDLGDPHSPRDVIALLHQVERAQLAAYVDAVPKLSPGYLRSSVSTILADDAQHVSLLRMTLGLSPVPSPFVNGGE